MRITCKCLNFIVEVESFLDLEIPQLDLTARERAHPYFHKDVYRMTGRINRKTETYANLIKSEIVGSWNICQCLVCKMYIHATNYVTGLSTCSTVLQEATDLKLVGRDEARSFSQVFQICFPSRLDVPDDYSSHIPGSEILDHKVIEKIEKQAKSFLEMAGKKMSGNAKTLTEQQRQGLEALRRRVHSEKAYLIQLMIKSKEEILKASSYTESSMPQFSQTHRNRGRLDRRLSYPLQAHVSRGNANFLQEGVEGSEFEHDFRRLQISEERHDDSSEEPTPPNAQSDSEDIFDMDDINPQENKDNDPQALEQDEFSEDDEASGLSFHRERRLPADEVARSAPLDIPSWPLSLPRQRGEEKKKPLDPQEIAASIKEMARNIRVSSVDVFGDLPRPQLPKDADTYCGP